MKITILENQSVSELEVIIKCQKADKEVTDLFSRLNSGVQKINAFQGETKYLVEPKNVFYFESVDKKTFLYLKSGILETTLRLYEVIEQSLYSSYFRAGKSIIINIDKIVSATPLLNGNLLTELTNGEKVFDI